MEGSHEVLALGQVHGHLAPDAGVHHGQHGGRDLDEGDAAQVRGGREAREVAHHAAKEVTGGGARRRGSGGGAGVGMVASSVLRPMRGVQSGDGFTL